MPAKPAHLQPVPDDRDERHPPSTAAVGSSELQQLFGLLRTMEQDKTVTRSRHVRRTEEILANKAILVTEAYAVGQATRALVHERMGDGLTRVTRRFDALIADLAPSLSEDQVKLLDIAKDEFIAAEYEAKAHTAKVLETVLRSALLTALSRPDDDFRRLSLGESFWDGVTNRRSTLKRRSLDPLTAWEELTDDLGLTNHARNRIHQDERARQRAFLSLLAGPEVPDGEDD